MKCRKPVQEECVPLEHWTRHCQDIFPFGQICPQQDKMLAWVNLPTTGKSAAFRTSTEDWAHKQKSPARRLKDLEKENQRLRRAVSERRVCETLGQHRSTQRKKPRGRQGE
jgi:hypothetical protein